MRIRRRRDELERRLDSERPQPPDEFISRLAGRLTPSRSGVAAAGASHSPQASRRYWRSRSR